MTVAGLLVLFAEWVGEQDLRLECLTLTRRENVACSFR